MKKMLLILAAVATLGLAACTGTPTIQPGCPFPNANCTNGAS